MKVIYVPHVAEDDLLLVGDSRRNLLHAVGHLPQVGLTDRQMQTYMKNRVCLVLVISPSHLQTLLQVPDVGLLCLQQLGHDEPEAGRQV